MASLDIVASVHPYGGHSKVTHYPLAVAAAFLAGEPVVVQADGTLVECITNPDITAQPPTLTGIAAAAAVNVAQLNTNSATIPANVLAPVIEMAPDVEFETRNLFSASDALVVPLLSHINDKGSLRLTGGGVWGIDVGAGNLHFRIVRVLDSLKRDIRVSGGTGVFVRFVRAEE